MVEESSQIDFGRGGEGNRPNEAAGIYSGGLGLLGSKDGGVRAKKALCVPLIITPQLRSSRSSFPSALRTTSHGGDSHQRLNVCVILNSSPNLPNRIYVSDSMLETLPTLFLHRVLGPTNTALV